MKKFKLLLLFICLSSLTIKANYDGLSKHGFIENKGQLADTDGNVHPEILFYSQISGATLYFKKNSIEYHFFKLKEKKEDEFTEEQKREWVLGNRGAILPKIYKFRLDLEFLNSLEGATVNPIEATSVNRNFYLSHCPDGIMNVKEYQEIIYENIYKNIDLKFYFEKGHLKYDFIVHPGGNPNDIKLRYNGFEKLVHSGNGDIRIYTELGELVEQKPLTYQEERMQNIESTFIVKDNIISFNIAAYNEQQDLIIDPVVHWATYYDNAYGSDTWTRPVFASDGSMFNAGYTYASTYTIINPGSGAWIDPTKDGITDFIIVKFNPLHQLVWATYYGGNDGDYLAGYTDYGKAMAIDENDNIFIAGSVASGTTTFPTLNPGSGAFYQSQTKIHGETSFILKFTSSGERIWATIFQHENANTNYSSIRFNGIVAKGSKVYFTGQTYRSNNNDIPLRTLSGAYNNSTYVGDQDAFIGRFSSAGVLEWCSYLNSGNTSLKAYAQGCDVVVDNSGNLFYIGRESYNSGNKKHYLLNPGSGAYYQDVNAGDQDITITKFNPTMNITWSTYYGGTLQDIPSMVEADNSGNIIIVCRSVRSTNFPTYNPGSGAYYQSTKAANGTASDAAIMKFSNIGVRQWATYYGGGGTYVSGGNTYDAETLISGVGVDNSNNLYFSGSTQSSSFPTQNESGSYFSGTRNGESDAIFLKFNNSGVRQWATYYGGSGNEGLYSGKGAIYNNNCESALVAFGYTNSANFPTVDPGGGAMYQSGSTTGTSNVIYYFTETSGALSIAPTSATATPTSVCPGGSTTLNVVGGSLGTGGVWKWYSGSCGGTNVGTGASISVNPTGTTTYFVRAEGDCNITACASVTVTLNTNSVAPTSLTATPAAICSGSSTITVNGGSLGTGAVWQLYSGSCGGTLITTNSTGSFNVSPTSTTTYFVRASGTCNTTTCASVTVTVNTSSIAPASLTATPTSICSGSSTITINGGTLGTGAEWQLFSGSCGGTLVASNTSGSFTVSPTGTTTYFIRANGTCNTTSCASVTVTVSTPSTAPTSLTASPTSICSGNSSTLTVNGGSLGTGAEWQLYSGSCGGTLVTTNTSGIFSVSPTSTTTYFVRASGTCNTTTCASVTVTVNTSSIAPASLTATPTSICSGSSIITINGGTLGTGAEWQLFSGSCGGTLVASNTSGSFTVSPTGTTTYFIRANGTCNTTSCASVTVTVSTPSTAPTSLTASPTSICSGNSSTLTVNGGSLGTGANWQLYSGSCGGTLITTNTSGSFSVSPSSTTTYYVRADGACNTTSCASVTVNVNTNSIAPASLSASPTALCSGGASTITVNGGTLGTGGSWQLFTGSCGGTMIASNTSGSFSVSPTSTTTYYVQGTGTCNTTACVSTSVTVSSISTAPSSLSASPSSICSGNSTTLTVNGGSLGAGANWELFEGTCGGTSLAANTSGSFTVTPSSTTTYYIRANGACNTTSCASVLVTVNISSTAPVSLTASPAAICSGNTSTLIVVGGTLGDGASWQLFDGTCGGAPIATNTSGSFIVSPSTTTSYYVYASGVCNTTTCATVTVDVNTNSTAPTSVTANPGTICSGDTTTLTVNGGILSNGASWHLYSGSCGGLFVESNTTGSFDVSPASTTSYYVQAVGLCNSTLCSPVTITVNQSSSAPLSLTATPSLVCDGSTSTLTVNGGSLGTGASWELFEANCGGTSIASNTSGVFTVTPTATTSYFVQASGLCNTTNCESTTISVGQSSIAPTSLIITPLSVCAGGTATVAVNGGSLGDGATWYLYSGSCGGTLVSSNSTGTFNITPNATTTYFVQAIGNCNTTNCISETLNYLNVPGNASIINGPDNVCVGTNNITYTIPSISDATTYVWTLPSGFTGSSTGNSITVNIPAGAISGQISVYGSNICGDGAAANLYITVNPLPVVSFSSSTDSLCGNNNPIILSGGLPAGGTYSGSYVSGSVFDPAAAGAGTHLITYTYTDANGCTNAANDYIIVLATPTVTLDSIAQICESETAIVLNSGHPAGGTYTGNNISQNVFYPTNAGAGTYNYSYVYTAANGCSDSAHATITVATEVSLSSDIPVSHIYIELGTPVNFTATPPNQGHYDFYVNTALTQSGTSNVFSYNGWQSNTIVYVVLNNACSDTIFIDIKPAPNAFNPFNADGKNDLFMPYTDLTIINRWGQILYQGKDGWDGRYNGKKVSAGTYFYIIKIKENQEAERIIKGIVTLVD